MSNENIIKAIKGLIKSISTDGIGIQYTSHDISALNQIKQLASQIDTNPSCE